MESRDRIIVDVTRAYPGTEVDIVENLLLDVKRPLDDLIVLGMARQIELLTGRFPGISHVVVGSLAPNEEVMRWLRTPGSLPAGTTRAYVFSFHRDVLNPAHFVGAQGVEYSFQPLNRFAQREEVRHEWPSQMPPIDEAADLLTEIVRGARSGIRKTDLRAHLQVREPRFAKSAPGSDTPGLISMLVQRAVERGGVTVMGTEPNPVILSPEVPPSPVLLAAATSAAAPPATMSVQSPPAVTHGLTTTTDTPATVGVSGTESPAKEKDQSKSRQFISLLRREGLGYQDARPLLYDQFEEVIKDQPGTPLGEVIDLAMSRTRELWTEAHGGRSFPWKGLRSCFERLLMQAPVALDATEQPVRPTWAGSGVPVVKLTAEWRQHLDGEMVVALVRGGADVRHADARDLAGALLLNRSPESIRYIHRAVKLLLDSGRLVEQEDGPLTLPGVIDKE